MADWIWTEESYDQNKAVTAYFRKTFNGEAHWLNITADTKYKLFINGKFVTLGPRKGDDKIWYYEHIELDRYLKEGTNVLSVIVLRYPPVPYKGNRSCWRLKSPFLYIESDNAQLESSTDYKCLINQNHSVVNKTAAYLRLFNEEIYTESVAFYGWKQADFDDSGWKQAIVCAKMVPSLPPLFKMERQIPLLSLTEKKFANVIHMVQSAHQQVEYQKMIDGQAAVIIAAHQQEIIEIEAEKLTTGYLRIHTSGGKGTHITLLQSESYNVELDVDGTLVNGRADRKDFKNGKLFGAYDEVYLLGKENDVYEPFDYKTFRFIRLTVETQDEPVLINALDYIETHYPLNICNRVESDNASYNQIYEASIDTLLNCMHETYEDCPAYEQLQYLWDTRNEALFSACISGDDRLTLNALDDFSRSQRHDGLLSACYPTYKPNIIPSFSFYYILILHDHMMYFGKKEIILKYMPVCIRILDFFINHLNEKGLIRPIEHAGGVSACYWNYIDLTKTWPDGIVNVDNNNEITMYSLEFAYGCKKMSELMDYVGFKDLSAYYLNYYHIACKGIRTHCFRNGLIYDSPVEDIYSVQSQVYGILNGILSKEEGRHALSLAMDTMERCSLSFIPYLLDALEKTELYDRAGETFARYQAMIDNNCTTLVEHDSPGSYRSDCHGWSGSMIYALYAQILGIRPSQPGFKEITFSPHLIHVNQVQGTIRTINGDIIASAKTVDGKLVKEIQLPSGIHLKENA